MMHATTKQLQGIGRVSAKRAADLQPGDITIWNFGGMYRVLAVEALSPKFVRLVMVQHGPSVLGKAAGDDAKVWHRRTNREFAVGVTTG